MNIRDQDKNIIKSFCYNYAGQPANCYIGLPTYTSDADNGIYVRACSTGSTGSSVTYTVPAGRYTSSISQADANSQARLDVVTNGQNYANANGVCVVNPVINSLSYAGYGQVNVNVFFTSIPNCTTAVIKYTDLNTGQQYSAAGSCNSPVMIATPFNQHTYRFVVTCYSGSFPSGISSASSDIYVNF
jgi:hypothetical protein